MRAKERAIDVSMHGSVGSLDVRGKASNLAELGGRAADQGRLATAGFAMLILLAITLPFDPTRHPLFHLDWISLTDVTIVLTAAALLAAVTMARRTRDILRASRLLPGVLLVVFLFETVVSAVHAGRLGQDEPLLLGMGCGGLMWVCFPLWINGRIEGFVRAFVAGATLAALTGFAEVTAGVQLDRSLLLPFKAEPTMMGPFIRLSGPFGHANIAAMYIDLALPFALMGVVRGLHAPRVQLFALLGWLAALNVLLLALLLTYSRGGLLGLAAALAVIAWSTFMRGRYEGFTTTSAHRLKVDSEGPGQAPPLRWLPVIVAGANLILVIALFAARTWDADTLRLSTINDANWYQAAYISHLPATMRAGSLSAVPVTIENRGPLPWRASTRGAYALSYHWLFPSRRVARFDTTLTPLTNDVGAGARLTVLAHVRAPGTPGQYLLVWDTVWHDSTWFGGKTGQYRFLPVHILPSPGNRRMGSSFRGGPPQPRYLPRSVAVTRTRVWEAAITLIRRYPVLGLGPGGFHTGFPTVAGDQGLPAPPHAHNLLLEMTADFGVLGGLLFLVLGLALWRPVLALLVSRRPANSWQIATLGAMGAFAAHGMVDDFMGTRSILVAIWLLAGLAATSPASCG
jgi:hypothetical protein